MKEIVNSWRRVEALAELGRRYGALIRGMEAAIIEVLPDCDPAVRERLQHAVDDANAQITAMNDALAAASADLPEGQDDRSHS